MAHLAADEPVENAAVVWRQYLLEAVPGGGGCRALTAEDARVTPFENQWEADLEPEPLPGGVDPVDRRGRRYRLELVQSRKRQGHRAAA